MNIIKPFYRHLDRVLYDVSSGDRFVDVLRQIKREHQPEYKRLMALRDAPSAFFEAESKRILAQRAKEAKEAGAMAHMGFKAQLNVWASRADFFNPFAKQANLVVLCNHMTYEGADNICNASLASGTTFFQTMYVGFVNGANPSYQTSAFGDYAGAIVASGTPSGGQNQWIEFTNYTASTRPALGALTFNGSGGVISPGVFGLIQTGTPPNVVAAGGGGSVSGIFFCTTPTQGVAGTASFYKSGGATNGPNLWSAAIASPTSVSAGQTINATPITFTWTLA